MNALEYFSLREQEDIPSIADGDVLVVWEGIAPDKPRGKNLSTPTSMPWWEQAMMYLGVAAGVFFSSYVLGNGSSFPSRWKALGMSCIIALVIIPGIYNKLKVPKGAPFVVKLGLFVQNGVFWHTLLTGVTKATGHFGSGP